MGRTGRRSLDCGSSAGPCVLAAVSDCQRLRERKSRKFLPNHVVLPNIKSIAERGWRQPLRCNRKEKGTTVRAAGRGAPIPRRGETNLRWDQEAWRVGRSRERNQRRSCQTSCRAFRRCYEHRSFGPQDLLAGTSRRSEADRSCPAAPLRASVPLGLCQTRRSAFPLCASRREDA